VGRQYDLAVAGEMGHGQRPVRADAGDRPAVAVADPQPARCDEAAVVAQGDDLVAGPDGLAGGGGQAAGLNVAVLAAGGLDAPSEPVDGGPVGGGDDHRLAGGPGGL